MYYTKIYLKNQTLFKKISMRRAFLTTTEEAKNSKKESNNRK